VRLVRSNGSGLFEKNFWENRVSLSYVRDSDRSARTGRLDALGINSAKECDGRRSLTLSRGVLQQLIEPAGHLLCDLAKMLPIFMISAYPNVGQCVFDTS
jgi:hypothetical protein